MKNTRKNKVICYTGVGAKKNGKHNVKSFRKITRKLYPKSECMRMKKFKKSFGTGKECPKYTNTNGWVKFFGAKYTSSKECNSIVKSN